MKLEAYIHSEVVKINGNRKREEFGQKVSLYIWKLETSWDGKLGFSVTICYVLGLILHTPSFGL